MERRMEEERELVGKERYHEKEKVRKLEQIKTWGGEATG